MKKKREPVLRVRSAESRNGGTWIPGASKAGAELAEQARRDMEAGVPMNLYERATLRKNRRGTRMNLFQRGEFTLHNGSHTSWKIDCDALTYEDFAALADFVVATSRGDFEDETLHRGLCLEFTEVYGVPTGGTAFAAALNKYCKPVRGRDKILIVDDVMTSGGSLYEVRAALLEERPDAQVQAVVIFNRGKFTEEDHRWIVPIFQAPNL